MTVTWFQESIQRFQLPQTSGDSFLDLADMFQLRNAEMTGERRELHFKVRCGTQLPIQKPVHAT